MKVVLSNDPTNLKINTTMPDFDENFKHKTKCYLNDDEYDSLLNDMKKPSIDELHTDVQLDVLDIKDFPYNKMDLDNFEDGTNIREELFNGAVADLVSNNNAEIVENTEECPTKKPKKRYVKKKKPHDLSKLQLTVRTTPRHYAKMFEYFEANPGLATGQLQKISYRKKWRELTSLLNAEGLGEKSTEKWQKTWSDYKLHLRKKISTLKQQKVNSNWRDQFNEMEERALAIVGLSLTEDTAIEAIHKRFTAPSPESEDSSSSSNNTPKTTTQNPTNTISTQTITPKLVQLKRTKRLRRKSLEYRDKTLKELVNIKRTLNKGLSCIGDNLQLLVKKIDSQNNVALQLSEAANALAASASNFASVLNSITTANKRNGNCFY